MEASPFMTKTCSPSQSFLALFLSAVLVVGMVPSAAFAQTGNNDESAQVPGASGAGVASASSAAGATSSDELQDAIAQAAEAAANEAETAPFSLAEISVSNKEYTGKTQKPKPVVTFAGLTLEEGVHYEVVEYKNNLIPGTATVTVRGIGLFSGTQKATFKIVRSAGNRIALPGKWVKTSKGYRYKYSHNGKYATSTWLQTGSKTYRMSSKGYRLTGLRTISGKTYYFDSAGLMKTGWKTVGSARYRFDSKTGAAKTGVFTVGDKTYVASSTGKLKKSTLVKLSSGKYAFTDSSGATTTKGLGVKNGKYTLVYKGKVVTGWAQVGKYTYYFNPAKKGAMVTGFKTIDGETYYFDKKSGVKKTNTAIANDDGTYAWIDSHGVEDREAGVAKVLAFAQKLVDNKTPYTYAGDLKNGRGTDCSGLVYYSYAAAKVTLSRSSYTQQKEGAHVYKGVVTSYKRAFANAKPGDLVFSNFKNGKSNHVALYAGKVGSTYYVYEARVPGEPAAYRSISSTVKTGDYIIIRRIFA